MFFRSIISALFLICRSKWPILEMLDTLIHAGDLDICLLAPDVTTSASQARRDGGTSRGEVMVING